MGNRILLIKHEPECIRKISSYLKEAGFAVSIATNGVTGYKKAIAELPDLIITDIILPGMDGLALCERLKTNLATQYIPIIAASFKAQDYDRKAAEKAGADVFLDCSVTIEDVVNEVNTLLHQQALV